LRDAVLRTCQAAETIGIRGLLVHALSPAAKAFYLRCGLIEAPRQPMTLMITLADAHAAAADEGGCKEGDGTEALIPAKLPDGASAHPPAPP
jgi:hypothetical protein